MIILPPLVFGSPVTKEKTVYISDRDKELKVKNITIERRDHFAWPHLFVPTNQRKEEITPEQTGQHLR